MYYNLLVREREREREADKINKDLQKHGFRITNEGILETYLGIRLENYANRTFKMSQPYFIDRIIETIPGMKDAKITISPATVDVILTKDPPWIEKN